MRSITLKKLNPLPMTKIIACSKCGVPVVVKGKYGNAKTAICSKCAVVNNP